MAAAESYEPVRADLVQLLLGETPDLTLDQVAGLLEADSADIRELWRALGFGDPGVEPAFAAGDVEVLAGLLALTRAEAVSRDTALHMARAVGRAMVPLSSWLSELVAAEVEEHGESSRRWQQAEGLGGVAIPVLSAVLDRTWRRHLLGAADRFASAEPNRSRLLVSVQTVGFADLVASTPMARSIEQHDWAQRATRFEDIAADVVADSGARLVKTLGDEVLFVAADPVSGVEAALGLITAVEEEPTIPALSVGVATGEVALRAGDVYGATVNLAARLVGLASPGELLADKETAKALIADRSYNVAIRVPRSASGFGTITPMHVTRSSP